MILFLCYLVEQLYEALYYELFILQRIGIKFSYICNGLQCKIRYLGRSALLDLGNFINFTVQNICTCTCCFATIWPTALIVLPWRCNSSAFPNNVLSKVKYLKVDGMLLEAFKALRFTYKHVTFALQ